MFHPDKQKLIYHKRALWGWDKFWRTGKKRDFRFIVQKLLGINLKRCFMVSPQDGKRISKADTYLNCAEVFAYRSTCLKRKYGAVIVKDDVVISTGYNGAPRGFENCCDLGKCPRIERDMHQGDGYGICRAVHAEANALLNCSRQQTIGADLYLAGVNPKDNLVHKAKPCPLCARTHHFGL